MAQRRSGPSPALLCPRRKKSGFFSYRHLYRSCSHSFIKAAEYLSYLSAYMLNTISSPFKSTDPQAGRLCTILPSPAFGFAVSAGSDRIAQNGGLYSITQRSLNKRTFTKTIGGLCDILLLIPFCYPSIVRGRIRTVLSPWAEIGLLLFIGIFLLYHREVCAVRCKTPAAAKLPR